MQKKDFQAIIDEINEAKLNNLFQPEDECEMFFGAKPDLIEQGLNVDKHRWYETSTNVYRIEGRFLGINGPSSLFSEQMEWDCCGEDLEAFEMEEVSTITYVKKTND